MALNIFGRALIHQRYITHQLHGCGSEDSFVGSIDNLIVEDFDLNSSMFFFFKITPLGLRAQQLEVIPEIHDIPRRIEP